jgi:hypothetical protein
MIRGLTDPLPINTAQRFLRLAGLWRQSATRRSGSLRGLSCDPVERRGPRAPRPTDGHIALLDRLGAAAGGVLGRGHLILSLATSIQIAPVPWLGWAAISLPAEPELILRIPLLAEELKHSRPRQPAGQRGDLLGRARLPQAAQQAGHIVRAV